MYNISSIKFISTIYSSYYVNPLSPAEQNVFANSVDPDETAHNEPSHQDLHCLPFCFDFWLRPLFRTMVRIRFKDGRVHFRNSGMKGLELAKNRNLKCTSRVTIKSIKVAEVDLDWIYETLQSETISSWHIGIAQCQINVTPSQTH